MLMNSLESRRPGAVRWSNTTETCEENKVDGFTGLVQVDKGGAVVEEPAAVLQTSKIDNRLKIKKTLTGMLPRVEIEFSEREMA